MKNTVKNKIIEKITPHIPNSIPLLMMIRIIRISTEQSIEVGTMFILIFTINYNFIFNVIILHKKYSQSIYLQFF